MAEGFPARIAEVVDREVELDVLMRRDELFLAAAFATDFAHGVSPLSKGQALASENYPVVCLSDVPL